MDAYLKYGACLEFCVEKLNVVIRIIRYFNLIFGIHKAYHGALLHCVHHHFLGLLCSVLFCLLLSIADS